MATDDNSYCRTRVFPRNTLHGLPVIRRSQGRVHRACHARRWLIVISPGYMAAVIPEILVEKQVRVGMKRNARMAFPQASSHFTRISGFFKTDMPPKRWMGTYATSGRRPSLGDVDDNPTDPVAIHLSIERGR